MTDNAIGGLDNTYYRAGILDKICERTIWIILIKIGARSEVRLSKLTKDRKGTHRSKNEVFKYLSFLPTGREKYLKVTLFVIKNHSQVHIPDCER